MNIMLPPRRECFRSFAHILPATNAQTLPPSIAHPLISRHREHSRTAYARDKHWPNIFVQRVERARHNFFAFRSSALAVAACGHTQTLMLARSHPCRRIVRSCYLTLAELPFQIDVQWRRLSYNNNSIPITLVPTCSAHPLALRASTNKLLIINWFMIILKLMEIQAQLSPIRTHVAHTLCAAATEHRFSTVTELIEAIWCMASEHYYIIAFIIIHSKRATCRSGAAAAPHTIGQSDGEKQIE